MSRVRRKSFFPPLFLFLLGILAQAKGYREETWFFLILTMEVDIVKEMNIPSVKKKHERFKY